MFQGRKLALVCALVLGSGIGQANAAEREHSPESRGVAATVVVEGVGTITSPSQDLLADIELIRSEGGRSPGQLESLLWQNDFANAITQIQESMPADYTASWLDPQDGSLWLAVPGRLSDGVRATLHQLPLDVNVVEGMGWTESEFVDTTESVHYALLGDQGIADVETGADPLTGVITAIIEPRPGAGTQGRWTSVAQSEVEASGQTFPIEIEIADLNGGNDALYGGSQLGGACTAGFSVRTGTYANGIMTADHCSNSASIGSYTLTYRGSAATSSGDVQWHSTTSTTTGAHFYISSSTLRPIYATANPIDGNTYCRYGRATGVSATRSTC